MCPAKDKGRVHFMGDRFFLFYFFHLNACHTNRRKNYAWGQESEEPQDGRFLQRSQLIVWLLREANPILPDGHNRDNGCDNERACGDSAGIENAVEPDQMDRPAPDARDALR